MTASVYLPTPEGFCFGVKRLYSHQSSSVTGASRVTAAIFHTVSCRFPLILQRNGHLNLIPTFFFFSLSLSFLSNFGYQGVLRILQYCLGWFRMFWNFHFLVNTQPQKYVAIISATCKQISITEPPMLHGDSCESWVIFRWDQVLVESRRYENGANGGGGGVLLRERTSWC